MKRLLLFASLFASVILYSQNNTTIGEYELTFQNDLVEVSLAQGDWEDVSRNISHARYFIQYKNLTNEEIEITLNKELHYGNQCYGCNGSEESYKTIIVPPNTTLSFNQENNDKRFYFFVKDNNGLISRQLSDFQIKIIQTQ